MPLTPDQLLMRARGIGGSEVGAVCGLSAYRGPHDVRNVKLGISTFEGNEHSERGDFTEDGIRQWACYRWKWKVEQVGTIVHPDHPLVIATPDGIVSGKDLDGQHLLEIKHPAGPGCRLWGEPETDEVPDEYAAQVTWGMAATGLRHAFVVALLNGYMVRYHIDYNHTFFLRLLKRATSFWQRYVVGDEVPPVDGTDGADDYLLKMFPHANESVVEMTEHGEQVVADYLNATGKAKDADRAKRTAAQRLKAHLGDASRLESEAAHVTYRNNKNGDRRLSVIAKGTR